MTASSTSRNGSQATRTERLRSKSLAFIEALQSMEDIEEDLKQDILYLIKGFGLSDEQGAPLSAKRLALEHPSFAQDLAWAHSQVSRLCDQQEFRMDNAWASACLGSEDVLKDEGEVKPTRQKIENFARTAEAWQREKVVYDQIKCLRDFLEHMRWELRTRMQAIQILANDTKRDSFYE